MEERFQRRASHVLSITWEEVFSELSSGMCFWMFFLTHCAKPTFHPFSCGGPDVGLQLDLNRPHCLNECMWFQISVPHLFPGRTCVFWCRSVPADYNTSCDREGSAVVGIRQAAGTPHPARSNLSPGPLRLQPAIVPCMSHAGARSFPNSPHRPPSFTLCIPSSSEWVFIVFSESSLPVKEAHLLGFAYSFTDTYWLFRDMLSKLISQDRNTICSVLAVWLKGLAKSVGFGPE